MSAFSQLKKNRESNNAKLLKTLEEQNKKGGTHEKDARLYYPARDAQGNGMAVIRFLPEKDLNVPFVRVYSHGFKGPGGKWLIENCPTTLGKDHSCPICEANSEAWRQGEDYYKKHASFRKRKTAFYANILVVSDAKNPENEGKVFLFQFGTKIMDMISGAMNPEFEDEVPMNAFDLDTGANFKLKIIKKDGNTNYDKSSFEAPSAVADGDEEAQEEIWAQEYNLGEFIDPKNFKSFEQLEKKFAEVQNGKVSQRKAGEEDGDDENEETPEPRKASKTDKFRDKPEAKTAEAKKERTSSAKSADPSEGEEDPMAYFENLAKQGA